MSLEQLFGQLPDPGTHAFPDYSLPKGEPVMPIAVTSEELTTVLELYEAFQSVDPTGLDSNPFLEAATTYMQQAFGVARYRPDEQLQDDIAALLNDFSDDLGGRTMGVVDATPDHHRTLYFFLVSCRGYHGAPHVRFDPDEAAVATLYEWYQRVTDQDAYLKHPASVLE
ncbi:hypothetical protein [Natronolimnohabitans innermongolicus]|uniref:Uncharacterized protein n=1 Tax=Natronolimnohabitans innermongolicus JCM 12255 TaxID=1227499 RepID=L9X0Y7_9EURY|nr:hypothetical protein [Natronolimnohabitans innermongolicus]ELY55106.1 hypothetical protein C493_11507 [Natronolimnohabitans innermongolicus JCM 12255]